MKTQMERMFPVLLDVGTQFEKSEHQFLFFYDESATYRAFACDKVKVEENVVHALRGEDIIITIPSDTNWRLLRRDLFEFVSGAQLDELGFRDLKEKKDLQKKMIEELGLDEEGNHEYKKGYNPKHYA